MHPFIHLHQPYVHLCSPVIHVYTPHLPLNNPLNNPLNTPLNALKQPIKQVPGTGLPLSMVVYLGRIPTMLYILFVYPLIALIAAVRSSKVHPPLYTCITIFTPMYTRYTCIYTIFTPNTPLNTPYTPYIRLKTTYSTGTLTNSGTSIEPSTLATVTAWCTMEVNGLYLILYIIMVNVLYYMVY